MERRSHLESAEGKTAQSEQIFKTILMDKTNLVPLFQCGHLLDHPGQQYLMG